MLLLAAGALVVISGLARLGYILYKRGTKPVGVWMTAIQVQGADLTPFMPPIDEAVMAQARVEAEKLIALRYRARLADKYEIEPGEVTPAHVFKEFAAGMSPDDRRRASNLLDWLDREKTES